MSNKHPPRNPAWPWPRTKTQLRQAHKRAEWLALRAAKAAHQAQRGAAMTQLYESGKTIQEIADQHGLSRERVRQLMNLHEVRDRISQPHFSQEIIAERRRRTAANWEKKYAAFRRMLKIHLYPRETADAIGAADYKPLLAMLRRNHPAEHEELKERITRRAVQRFLAKRAAAKSRTANPAPTSARRAVKPPRVR